MRGCTLLFLAAAACGGGGNNTGIPDQCNPLGGQGCLLPWPSMTYTKADSSSATGIRLDLPLAAMPKNVDGSQVDPAALDQRWNGFSNVGPMLAQFPTGVSPDGLPPHTDPAQSLAAASPIVLVDMDTGERTPFFAEVDQNEPSPHGALIIRPLARLHPGARYAVAIRNTVKAADGSPLKPSPGFAAIRDGGDFNHPRFGALKSRYDSIFAALATAGVDKHELVLAWDFVTATDDMLQSDLTTMRAAALPAMGTGGANLTFTTTEQPAMTGLLHRYLGTFKSPNFLTDGEADTSVMVRDGTGKPMLSGLRDAQFAAVVPDCVQTQPLPRPVIVFGHGLFGSAAQYLSDGLVIDLAQQHCMIIVAGDFIGLTSRQLALLPLAVNDLNRGAQITDKLGQSISDFIALETIVRGPMATSPAFSFNGAPIIDPSKVYYVGGSLGGIMGNTFMAYDPTITKGVLAVPGGNWSLLIERSNAWSLLVGSAQGAYADPDVYQLLVALLGMALEPYDPITTAAHVVKDPLPGTPLKNILIWYSLGDCLVTNIATEMVARTMGIDVIGPSVRSPFGLAPKLGPMTNAVEVFDAHPTPLPPTTNVAPTKDNGTHSGINRKPAALRMAFQFLLQGTVTQQCLVNGQPAPCDCATGACD